MIGVTIPKTIMVIIMDYIALHTFFTGIGISFGDIMVTTICGTMEVTITCGITICGTTEVGMICGTTTSGIIVVTIGCIIIITIIVDGMTSTGIIIDWVTP